MSHVGKALALLLTVSALGATEARAQSVGPQGAAGSDILTLNLYGGGYAPTSTIAPGADFRDSGTVGGAATLWLHRYVGVRGNVLYAKTDAPTDAPTPLEDESPDVWAYSGDLVLRLPLTVGEASWFPYLVGGVGGKTYDFEQNGTETDFAGNFGGGIEYRFTRVGLQAEVRDVVSSFERFGIDESQHDVVWTAGITLSF